VCGLLQEAKEKDIEAGEGVCGGSEGPHSLDERCGDEGHGV